MYIYSFVASFTTDSFFRYADHSYETNWYDLPYGLKKYVLIMISYGQRSSDLHGFDLFRLNLDTFAKVI